MLHGGEAPGREIKVDFSVNTNPLGMPETVKEALTRDLSYAEHYPDRTCLALTEAIAAKEGLEHNHLIVGNGASELLMLAFLAAKPKRVFLSAPSFLGYLHAAHAVRAEVKWHTLRREQGFRADESLPDALGDGIDMAVLCSPSNPVGNCMEKELLREVIRVCEEKRIRLIVDECFLSFTEREAESVRHLTATHQMLGVLDAFTKRYAMAGLRLGYLWCGDPDFLEEMRRLQPEWSVSGPAQVAGLAALKTPDSYLFETRALIARERVYLEDVLRECGCIVVPGEANYIFFSSEKPLMEPLLAKGILIRNCGNYEGLEETDYRMAIKDHTQNAILADALRKICV